MRTQLLALLTAVVFGAGATAGFAQNEGTEPQRVTKRKVVSVGAPEESAGEAHRRVVRVFSTSGESDSEDEAGVVFIGADGPRSYSYSYGFPRKRGFLGVQLVDLTPALREHFGAPEDAGVMVSSIATDSPAARAGLEVGDVVSAIDGEQVATAFEVARRISVFEDGSTVALEIWRDGRVETLSATIEVRERTAVDLGRFVLPDPVEIEKGIRIDLERLPETLIEIDEDGIHKALSDLRLKWQDEGMLEPFQILGRDRLDLQERIQELEKRLKELEEQLDELPQD